MELPTNLRKDRVGLGLERRDGTLDGRLIGAILELDGLGDREDSKSEDEREESGDTREQHDVRVREVMRILAEGSSRQYEACLLLFLMSREPAFIDESLYEWTNISPNS